MDAEDTDVCGAGTTGSDPCQNPTTDDGDPNRCWIPSHNDPDAENPQGREYAIDADDHEDILDAARMGVSKAGCARAAGIGEASLQRYLENHDDFRSAFAQARATGEQRLLTEPLYTDEDAVREMDGQHARFILSTSFDYKKTERKEVTGADGEAVDIDVSSEVVTVETTDE